LRFNPGETENDGGFAAGLGCLAQLYVNDAFGTAHRAHASTVGVASLFDVRAAGFLMERELKQLGRLLQDPARPFIAVLGGAKVKGKVEVILNLLDEVDKLLLGGGMIFTFFKQLGLSVGNSLVDEGSLEVVKDILAKAKRSRAQLVLPEDCIVSDDFSESGNRKQVLITDIPDSWQGLDIGEQTVVRYCDFLTDAKAIFWNGPMGVFEIPAFAVGTQAVGESIAAATDAGAISVVGGGDSVAALNQLGIAERISHVSTGGGASLEFMAGRQLPGVAALSDA
jgi:phosphoglycerate kinase